jgi:hypothetical protein
LGAAANDVSSRKAIRLEQCRERVAELAWLDVAGWGEATLSEDYRILDFQVVGSLNPRPFADWQISTSVVEPSTRANPVGRVEVSCRSWLWKLPEEISLHSWANTREMLPRRPRF